MGLNFQYYDGLQPKIRAGILNEHVCIGFKSKENNENDMTSAVWLVLFSAQIYGRFQLVATRMLFLTNSLLSDINYLGY